MKNIYFIIVFFVTLMLMSCSLLSPVKSEPDTQYVLSQLPNVPIQKNKKPITLLVAQPNANALYRTQQMAYRTQPYQVAYFAKNSWSNQPTDMIQPLIIQALQNTHRYHAIVGPSSLGKYDYILNTQLEELLQDYTSVPAMLRLKVRAEIVSGMNYRVIAEKQITLTIPILQRMPYYGVIAANQATAVMLRQLTLFCVNRI